jgi:hypothetical protein
MQTNGKKPTKLNKMKKTIFLLAFLITVASTLTFANGTGKTIAKTTGTSAGNIADNIATQVNISFKQDFKNAELISSEVSSHFTKLTFRMNDMILLAFYADNGKLLAIVHNIPSSQLPINLMRDLKKDYAGYWITELFELNGKGQNAYYISLENADHKVVLRSNEDNDWEIYQHTEKK